MDKIDQVMMVMKRSNVTGWSLRIVTLILLLTGLMIACVPPEVVAPAQNETPTVIETSPQDLTEETPPNESPELTEAPGMEQVDCTFSQEGVGEYKVWFQQSDCSKRMVVAIPTEVPVSQVVELPWDDNTPFANPEGNGDDFSLNRAVINFELLDQDGQLVTDFSSPIRLYLAYTPEDLNFALEDEENIMAFAYLGDNMSWVEFKRDKHGYSLLRIQKDGETFEYWDWDKNWIPLVPPGSIYEIGGEEVDYSQLYSAYRKLADNFPNLDGFAFVHTSGWGDRHIGAGR